MAHLSKEEIVSLAADCQRDVWQSAHAKWAENDRYYSLDIQVEVPKFAEKQKVVPSTAHNKVNHAADQLVSPDPAVFRRPVGQSEKDRAIADKLASWGGLTLRNLNRQMALPPFKSFFKHLVLYGYASMYGPTFEADGWPVRPDDFRGRRGTRRHREWMADLADWERRLRSIFPFRLEVPHPSKIILDPTDEKQPTWGILQSRRSAKSLQERYGLEGFHGAPYDQLQCWTYWSQDQYTMVVGDELSRADQTLQDGENPYGFVPFVQAFAGFGRDTAYGSEASALSARCEGLLDFIKSSLDSEVRIASAMENMVFNWGFQRLLVRGDAKKFADAMEISPVLGVNDPQADVRWQDVPNVPAWVLQLWAERKADAEAGTFGEVLRGQRIQGVSTASQHAQIVAKAKLVFNQPLQQLNHATGIFLGNCGRLVNVVGDPVTMIGEIEGERKELKIEPADFQDDYAFDVDFEGMDPMEKAADMETGLALRQSLGPQGAAPGLAWADMMKNYVHEADVVGAKERLEKEMAVARARADPAYWGMIMARVQAEWSQRAGVNGSAPNTPMPNMPMPNAPVTNALRPEIRSTSEGTYAPR